MATSMRNVCVDVGTGGDNTNMECKLVDLETRVMPKGVYNNSKMGKAIQEAFDNQPQALKLYSAPSSYTETKTHTRTDTFQADRSSSKIPPLPKKFHKIETRMQREKIAVNALKHHLKGSKIVSLTKAATNLRELGFIGTSDIDVVRNAQIALGMKKIDGLYGNGTNGALRRVFAKYNATYTGERTFAQYVSSNRTASASKPNVVKKSDGEFFEDGPHPRVGPKPKVGIRLINPDFQGKIYKCAMEVDKTIGLTIDDLKRMGVAEAVVREAKNYVRVNGTIDIHAAMTGGGRYSTTDGKFGMGTCIAAAACRKKFFGVTELPSDARGWPERDYETFNKIESPETIVTYRQTTTWTTTERVTTARNSDGIKTDCRERLTPNSNYFGWNSCEGGGQPPATPPPTQTPPETPPAPPSNDIHQ